MANIRVAFISSIALCIAAAAPSQMVSQFSSEQKSEDLSPAASGYEIAHYGAYKQPVEYLSGYGKHEPYFEGSLVPDKVIYGEVDLPQYHGGEQILLGGGEVPFAPIIRPGIYLGGLREDGAHKKYYNDAKGDGYYGGDEVYSSKGEIGKAGYFGSGGGGKGVSSHHNYGGHDAELEAQRKDQADAGYYGGNIGLKKGSEQSGSFQGGHGYGHSGRNAVSAGSKGDHKKGHHVSGFHNTYHKDESGKNSHYYDDSDDKGEHSDFSAEDKGFGHNGGESFKGGHIASEYEEGDRGESGHIGDHLSREHEKGGKGSYGGSGYHGQKAGFGGSRGGHEYYDVGNKFSKGGGQFYNGGRGGEGYEGTAGFYGKGTYID